MISRLGCGVFVWALAAGIACAQDVPGIEICTAEKAMERRTSCLQSNVEFLQKAMARQSLEHQQKLEAANRQIDALKASVVGLQKTVGDLQAAQQKTATDARKADTPPKDAGTKDAPAKDSTAKDGTKDAAKEGGK